MDQRSFESHHGARNGATSLFHTCSIILARLTSRLPTFAPLPLRLIVGYGFMEHGVAKLSRGLDAFPALLQALHVPFPKLMGLLTIAVEIFGGLAVLAGALVPLASIPMAIVLLVAIFTVHLQYGFSSIKLQAITPAGAKFGQPGYETDLLYLAALTALVFGGPGPLSLDSYLKRRWSSSANLDPQTAEVVDPSLQRGSFGADGPTHRLDASIGT